MSEPMPFILFVCRQCRTAVAVPRALVGGYLGAAAPMLPINRINVTRFGAADRGCPVCNATLELEP